MTPRILLESVGCHRCSAVTGIATRGGCADPVSPGGGGLVGQVESSMLAVVDGCVGELGHMGVVETALLTQLENGELPTHVTDAPSHPDSLHRR